MTWPAMRNLPSGQGQQIAVTTAYDDTFNRPVPERMVRRWPAHAEMGRSQHLGRHQHTELLCWPLGTATNPCQCGCSSSPLTVADEFRYNLRGDVTEARQSLTVPWPGSAPGQAYLPVGCDDGSRPAGHPDLPWMDFRVNYHLRRRHGVPARSMPSLNGVATNAGPRHRLATADHKSWPSLTFGNGLTYQRNRDAGGRLSGRAPERRCRRCGCLQPPVLQYDIRNRVRTLRRVEISATTTLTASVANGGGQRGLPGRSGGRATLEACGMTLNGNLELVEKIQMPTAQCLTLSDPNLPRPGQPDNRVAHEAIYPRPTWGAAPAVPIRHYMPTTCPALSPNIGEESYRYDAAPGRLTRYARPDGRDLSATSITMRIRRNGC